MPLLSREAVATAQEVLKLVAEAGGKSVEDLAENHDMTLTEAGLDSLDSVELTMKFEEVFGIEISDNEGAKIKTVRDLQLLVAKKVNEKKQAA